MSSSINGTATVESLAEVFRCFICMEKLRDARLCPHCSKLCCYPCIRRWLNDQHQQCPHCRATLRLHDLVNCRWAEEVTSQINNLKINEISKQKHEEKDKCELHKEKLTVYCSSCSKCICHQCALFNGSHAAHAFLPLDDVYKTNISIINEQLGQLKQRHVEFICLIQDIERNVESIKSVRDERFREIRNAMHAMQAKLNEQFKTKLDTLDTQHGQLIHETEIIEHALHDIEHRISNNGKVEVIDKQQDLLNSIQMICRKPITSFIKKSISCDFPNEMVPQYNSSTFIIENFSLHQHNVHPIYSQSLYVNGLTWRLKVYPDGNGNVRGTYLSVFLELTNGLNEPSKYEYRIEMIHQLSKDLSKNIIREFASDFEVGECWGYNRFYLLDALITEGFIDMENDTLILRFQVRPSTYQQQSRDQQWYIKHLENDNLQLTNEIKNLRENVLSLTLKKKDDEENLTDTPVDINEMDDDDQYTSLESDQINSDDDENALTENEVKKSATEHNLNRYYSRLSNEKPTARTTASDDEVESVFYPRKYESLPMNETVPFVSDEDFILADILERSANNDEDINSHTNNNQSIFRPITPTNTTETNPVVVINEQQK